MLFEGQTIKVDAQDGGIAELRFERGNEAVNKLDALTFSELRRAIDAIKATPAIRGVLVTSAKDNFIVGADIFEFTRLFTQPEPDVAAFVAANSEIITALGDLPVPTVAAINGLALGGGLEVALAADYRVLSNNAKIGFPEITLGLFPGYGGTVRLPRLIGLATSAEWIISGAQQSPDKVALAGAADAVAAPDILRFAALALLEKAITGQSDWQTKRARLKQSLGISKEEAATLLAPAKARPPKRSRICQPHISRWICWSKLRGSTAMPPWRSKQRLSPRPRSRKRPARSSRFSSTSRRVKKSIRSNTPRTHAPVQKAAVAGAGIMGGGIAYQSASRGVPIIMKDIAATAVDHGMAEARKLVAKAVETGTPHPRKGRCDPRRHHAEASTTRASTKSMS